jgi:hypothetical protein
MTIMCNRSGKWTSRVTNTEFQSVFAVNWNFLVKPKAITPLDFELKFDFF